MVGQEEQGALMYFVTCSSGTPTSRLPGIVGKALYKRLDGAYSYKATSNTSEVKSTILYQIPVDVSNKYNLVQEEREQVNVMDVTISLTTYSNKVRVNVIEMSPNEKTLGHKTFVSEKFSNVQDGVQEVLTFVAKCIRKEFDGYDILF